MRFHNIDCYSYAHKESKEASEINIQKYHDKSILKKLFGV